MEFFLTWKVQQIHFGLEIPIGDQHRGFINGEHACVHIQTYIYAFRHSPSLKDVRGGYLYVNDVAHELTKA